MNQPNKTYNCTQVENYYCNKELCKLQQYGIGGVGKEASYFSNYLYIKNLDSVLENYIYLRNETESDTALAAKVGGGEFAFIPLSPDKTYAVHGTKIDQMVEYGVFGNDNSSVVFGGSGS